MNAKLGERIHSLRAARDLTQEQVAEYLGMSRQKYARIEKGVNDVTLEILVGLAKLFEIEINDITCVLDTVPEVSYRAGGKGEASVDMVHEMLDLFYANKHMCEKLQRKRMF